MCLIIANVLATSYCNLAAPLVCLDLWEHVESIKFFQGAMPRDIFGSKKPGPEAAKGNVDRRIFGRDRGKSR